MADVTAPPQILAVCPGCTLLVVREAYRRHPWFRIFRGPLWLGMWVLSWWHGFSADDYLVRNPTCYDCLRFRKNLLTEKSALFNALNRLLGRYLGRMLGELAPDVDLESKKAMARRSTFRTLDEAVSHDRHAVEQTGPSRSRESHP